MREGADWDGCSHLPMLRRSNHKQKGPVDGKMCPLRSLRSLEGTFTCRSSFWQRSLHNRTRGQNRSPLWPKDSYRADDFGQDSLPLIRLPLLDCPSRRSITSKHLPPHRSGGDVASVSQVIRRNHVELLVPPLTYCLDFSSDQPHLRPDSLLRPHANRRLLGCHLIHTS